jgi:hypothetical protein
MNKKLVLCSVLALIVAGGIFAQEKKGYIKPTFGIGFSVYSANNNSETFSTSSLDVDFVNSLGITFGLQNLMAWNDDLTLGLPCFGVGYTYTANIWSAGAKLMAVPLENDGGGIGFDFNGTYWFKDFIGLTGIMDIYFGLGNVSWKIFSMRIAASIKV